MDIAISWHLTVAEEEFIKFICSAILDALNVLITAEAPEVEGVVKSIGTDNLIVLCEASIDSVLGGS